MWYVVVVVVVAGEDDSDDGDRVIVLRNDGVTATSRVAVWIQLKFPTS